MNLRGIRWMGASLLIFLLPMMVFAQDGAKTSGGEEKAIDVKAVLDKFDDLWRGDSSEAKITMNIKTKHWERSLTMKTWSLGKDRSLVKVLKPLKERNTATLKVGNEIYNYLPKTDKTIKLTSAMMLGSWMGSHFTNDDLVKESRMADDYKTTVTFVGKRGDQEVIELTSIPTPNAAVVWGKVTIEARLSDWQPLKVVYYDEDGEEARTMTLEGHKMMSGRLLPTVMRMVPADKPKEFTEFVYNEIDFDVKLKESFFSLNQLRR